jgi:hypothetical protein
MNTTLLKKLAWYGPIAAILIATMFYIRSYNGSEKKVQHVQVTGGKASATTTITITKEATPRMIDYPHFSRLRSGIVEDDVAYVIHINLVGRPDHEIEKIFVPARNDRPSNWSDPLAGKNIARIGFTLDPSSAKDIGHIEYVVEGR